MATPYGSFGESSNVYSSNGHEIAETRPVSTRSSLFRITLGILTVALIVCLAVVNSTGGLFLLPNSNVPESSFNSIEKMGDKSSNIGILIDTETVKTLPVLSPSTVFEDINWYHTSKPTQSPNYVKKTSTPTTPTAHPTHAPDFGQPKIPHDEISKSPSSTKRPSPKPTSDPELVRTSKPTKSPSTTKSPSSTKKPTFKPTKSPSYTTHPTKPTSEDATKAPNHTRRPTYKPTKSPDYVKESVKPTIHSHNTTHNSTNDDGDDAQVFSVDDDDNFV